MRSGGGAAAARDWRGRNRALRFLLIAFCFAFISVMLVLPLCQVLWKAFEFGVAPFWRSVSDQYAIKALHLSLLTTALAVACNTSFGICAAWALTRFSFRGKGLLITLIDVPFAVSPVIAGLVFIMTFGRLGWAYPFLSEHDIKVVFAVPGLVLATIFVTFPFVAREIIPVLTARGTDEEEAAVLMGAGLLQTFRRVTFPHIRWALLYGVILCTARAMGEFGAVSVVSGHLRGRTNTLPLHIEILFREYHTLESFSCAAILVAAAVLILVARNVVEGVSRKDADYYVR
ncbi:MAG: sulfate ABC transporter permease subunit CysW [Deltaproteobacteria bacterium]|jgi:sulfate transport system permease protein|nr:sulfate ABC transporter permease subunit CysW [Deltaproteobacteria bacterium]